MQKLGKTFYLFKETSFIVIVLNREVQLYVPSQESYPTPLNYIDVMSAPHADLKIAQENEFMTVGMSMRTEICQIRGRISQDLRDWTKLVWKDITNPGEIDENDVIWTWCRLMRIGKAAQRRKKQE